jgi:hypothetical protein
VLCLVLKQTGHHQNIRNRRAVQFQCGELILVNIYYLDITSVADPDPQQISIHFAQLDPDPRVPKLPTKVKKFQF